VSIYNITSNSAEIRWTAPDNTGGVPLTGYVVEIREVTRTVWRRAATLSAISTSVQLRDLTPGAEYVVRIIAKNQEGDSIPLTSDFIAVPKAKGAYDILQKMNNLIFAATSVFFGGVDDTLS
jgi:phosphodiesterase/alkaline phosphatase D-like protein